MVFFNTLCKAYVYATASCKASCKACTSGPIYSSWPESRTIRIWSFGCGFACATTMGCAGFRLPLSMIIVLKLLTIIKYRPGIKDFSSGFRSLLNNHLKVRFKLSWVTILNCLDTIAIIRTACCPAYLFFLSWGIVSFFLYWHYYLSWLYAR